MKKYLCSVCQEIVMEDDISEHGIAHNMENAKYFAETGKRLFESPFHFHDYEDTPQGFMDRAAKKMILEFHGKLYELPQGFHWGFKSDFIRDESKKLISWEIRAVIERTFDWED